MFKSSQSFQSKARQYSRKGTSADLLIRHVRDRGGDAPSVYTAARIDRRTYSSIVSHPFRPVSKRTAIQFALALHLERPDAVCGDGRRGGVGRRAGGGPRVRHRRLAAGVDGSITFLV